MLNIKYMVLAIFGASISLSAHAGMYVPTLPSTCSGVNGAVPCIHQGWELGVYAMYAQSSGLNDSATLFNSNSDSTVVTNSFNTRPEADWGYRVEGGYHFDSGVDISLNWTVLDETDGSTVTSDNPVIIPNFITLNKLLDAPSFEVVNTSLRNDYNAVNLEFGQLVNFGERTNIRFHAGIEYASIDQYIMQTAFNVPELLFSSNITNRYQGAGPRFGMDDSYDLPAGFSIVGSSAVALLYGSATSDTVQELIVENLFVGAQNASDFNSRRIVPAFEGKLGLKYSHPCETGVFSIEAGYKVAKYWDALNNELTSVEVSNDLNGDYAYQGAYAGLAWVG